MLAVRIIILQLIFITTSTFSQSKVDYVLNGKSESEITLDHLLSLFTDEPLKIRDAIEFISDSWTGKYIPPLIDVLHLSRSQHAVPKVIALLKEKTGKKFGPDPNKWLEYIWQSEQEIFSFQGEWMASLYPLRYPTMITSQEADYLDDDNIVFGVTINGDHRAYPKRILAWHEMFIDEIGGINIAGVYCTLCGTVIAYDTQLGDWDFELGTSGFLYRSNKLMYDKETQSLWNTIAGRPVLGPLAEKDITLKSYSVVTTTWGEWSRLHPDTKVLSIDTGHNRDYSEGVAYKKYFGTDKLMFAVPKENKKLYNKDEVLIVRPEGYQDDPLAISVNFLKIKKVYHNQIGDTKFVVLTDKSGANRVYESGDIRFKKYKNQTVRDHKGNNWTVTEEKLLSENGSELNRLPYHRMFWFAWYNTYSNTRLIR